MSLRITMTTPFERAWALLKSMPAFRPRSLDEQIGMGTYRTVYTDPVGKPGHVTKFGTGENLADTLALHQFAEEYPHLFEPEELHEMPGGTLQDWIMQSLKNPKEHILAPSMLERAKFPFTYTQREGVPLERTGDWGMQDEFDLREKLYHAYPALRAAGLQDIKPENWMGAPGGTDEFGHDVPVKIMDPMFNLSNQRVRGRTTEEGRKELHRIGRDLPNLEDYARPWERTLDQNIYPGAEAYYDQLLSDEQERLMNIFNL